MWGRGGGQISLSSKLVVLGMVVAMILGVFLGYLVAPQPAIPEPEIITVEKSDIIGIYFSPDGEAEEQVIYWIGKANFSIHILIFSFTLDSVGDALVDAHVRDIDIKVVFEKSQISQYSEYPKLLDVGIEVRNDTNSRFMHNKVMIVDGVVVLTGSTNYSQNAVEYNNENLVIIKNEDIAMMYGEEFQRIWSEGK